jgi:hypothetical protein
MLVFDFEIGSKQQAKHERLQSLNAGLRRAPQPMKVVSGDAGGDYFFPFFLS